MRYELQVLLRSSYINFSSCPLSYCGLAFLKSSLLEEMSEICRPMAAGRCLVVVGGWLELLSM